MASTVPPPSSAPARAPRLGILLFQVAQQRNFIHDDLMPHVVAELRARGIDVDVYETTLPASDGPDAQDLSAVDLLVERLREARHDVLAYTRLWSEAVFRRLRTTLPDAFLVHVGDARFAFQGTDLRVSDHGVPALEAATRERAAGRTPSRDIERYAEMDDQAMRIGPPLVPIRIGKKPPPRPAVVRGSPGCPYNKDVRENPRFKDVHWPVDTERASRLVLAGCSFCSTGGVSREPVERVMTSVLTQLDAILDHEPGTTRIQLNDQNPLPYLVPFVERLAERAAQPVEIMLETRADWFLGGLPVFERALAACERTGHRMFLFLVGVENFSARELELFNKGVTAEDNAALIEACRTLKQKYPKGYSDTRPAFGFILYNPWTELTDLETNADWIDKVRMTDFRGEITRSKLRLYPDTALYYKARQDGLLAERFPYEAMDSARRYGYTAETPWRFASRETDRVYGIHDAFHRRIGRHNETRMLREIIAFVRENPDRLDEDAETLATVLQERLGGRVDAQFRFNRKVPHGPGAGT